MKNINETDQKLVEAATNVIQKNYDSQHLRHTVGAAIRTVDGHVYTGINVYSIHGACAELIAMGKAMTDGHRDFDTIVSVRLMDDQWQVVAPCGNCRQLFADYFPNGFVLMQGEDGLEKVPVLELIPDAYFNRNSKNKKDMAREKEKAGPVNHFKER